MTRDILVGIDAVTSVTGSVAFARDGRQLESFALPNRWTSVAGEGHSRRACRGKDRQ